MIASPDGHVVLRHRVRRRRSGRARRAAAATFLLERAGGRQLLDAVRPVGAPAMTIVRVGAGAAVPDLLTVAGAATCWPVPTGWSSRTRHCGRWRRGRRRRRTGSSRGDRRLVARPGRPRRAPRRRRRPGGAGARAASRAGPTPDDVVPGTAPDAAERALALLGALGADLDAVRPLRGLGVVVTRAAAQAEELSRPLRRLGARVVELPTIRIEPPADGGAALAAALADPARYDWLVITSVNGARAVLDRLPDARRLAGVRLAAIGPATAAVLAGRPPPRRPGAAPLRRRVAARRLPARARGRVLVARAAVARDVLPDGLRRAGWEVDVVEAYRTVRRAAVAGAARRGRARQTSSASPRRPPSSGSWRWPGAERLAPARGLHRSGDRGAPCRPRGIEPAVVAAVHTDRRASSTRWRPGPRPPPPTEP